jgi:hypothetical protein
MKHRQDFRHDAGLLAKDLTRVMLVLPGKHELESKLVDICSQGLKVSIPPSSVPLSIPGKDETIGVVIQAIQLHLTCRCIYFLYNPDDSVCMGFYVFDPDEQSKLRELLEQLE